MVYYESVKQLGKSYRIDVEYISDEVLNLDNKGRCQFKDCKCNQKKHSF